MNGCGHFQAASSEPMFPLSAVVINHLGKVGGELMEAEVRIYEQGICHTVATAWSLVLPSSPSFLSSSPSLFSLSSPPPHTFVSPPVREKEKGRSDVQWLRTVLSSGTLSDKMAALTLVIQVRSHLELENTTFTSIVWYA